MFIVVFVRLHHRCLSRDIMYPHSKTNFPKIKTGIRGKWCANPLLLRLWYWHLLWMNFLINRCSSVGSLNNVAFCLYISVSEENTACHLHSSDTQKTAISIHIVVKTWNYTVNYLLILCISVVHFMYFLVTLYIGSWLDDYNVFLHRKHTVALRRILGQLLVATFRLWCFILLFITEVICNVKQGGKTTFYLVNMNGRYHFGGLRMGGRAMV